MISTMRTDIVTRSAPTTRRSHTLPLPLLSTPPRSHASSAHSSPLPATPERLRLPTFASTESVYTLSSPSSSRTASVPSTPTSEDVLGEHLAYPQVLAQLTATFLPTDYYGSQKTPTRAPRSRRFRTTPDLRKEHLTLSLISTPLHATASESSLRSLPSRTEEQGTVAREGTGTGGRVARRLAYQGITDLQLKLQRSPSLHPTIVNVDEEYAAWTETGHRALHAEPLSLSPETSLVGEPEIVSMPDDEEEPSRGNAYRARETEEFAGWLKPTAPSPSSSPVSSEVAQLSTLPPLARSRALRREKRKITPTTLHWGLRTPAKATKVTVEKGQFSDPKSASPTVSSSSPISPPGYVRLNPQLPLLSSSPSTVSSSSPSSIGGGFMSPSSRSIASSASPLPKAKARVGEMLGSVMQSMRWPGRR